MVHLENLNDKLLNCCLATARTANKQADGIRKKHLNGISLLWSQPHFLLVFQLVDVKLVIPLYHISRKETMYFAGNLRFCVAGDSSGNILAFIHRDNASHYKVSKSLLNAGIIREDTDSIRCTPHEFIVSKICIACNLCLRVKGRRAALVLPQNINH